jgi:hypothetical protein
MLNKFFLVSILINSIYGQNNTIQTGCSTPTCVFSNQNLRFGSGYENSINNAGLFVQPWYYSYISNSWYKLTFSAYPLDTAIGTGYGSSHWSRSTVVDLYSLTLELQAMENRCGRDSVENCFYPLERKKSILLMPRISARICIFIQPFDEEVFRSLYKFVKFI